MRSREQTLHTVLHVLLVLLSTVYVVPFLWMISTSLKLSGREIMHHAFRIVGLLRV